MVTYDAKIIIEPSNKEVLSSLLKHIERFHDEIAQDFIEGKLDIEAFREGRLKNIVTLLVCEGKLRRGILLCYRYVPLRIFLYSLLRDCEKEWVKFAIVRLAEMAEGGKVDIVEAIEVINRAFQSINRESNDNPNVIKDG